MATTIRQAFDQYSTNLELKDRQENLVSQRRANVVATLKQEIVLHSEESKVIGSWDRRTLTRYLSEGDVDVMVILHYAQNKQWDSGSGTVAALDRFRVILDETYPDTEKRRDRNCVTLQFSEFRLDVVPAFKINSGYYRIPDSVRRQWTATNPFDFADKITAINKRMSGSFVPLIKMMKGWNREAGWPIRSLHLECLMYHRYKSYDRGYTYPSMLKVSFQNLPQYLADSCYDPVMGDRLDTYLDDRGTRQQAIRKARVAAAAASEALEAQENNPATAIRAWKALLGEFFPAYG